MTQAYSTPGVIRHIRDLVNLLAGSAGWARLFTLAVCIVVVIGATAFAQLRLNAWNQPFFDAIERKDFGAFIAQLIVFGVIASTLLVLNVAQTWLDETLKVETRRWLTRDLLKEWLIPKRPFLIATAGEIGVNPDQRIHEDARRLTELSVTLAIGFFQSTLLLGSFIGVLWILSEGFMVTLGGQEYAVPGFMVWCALIYAASGSWLSWLVGRPLVGIGQARAAQEADLRFSLVRVSEAADGIALSGGEHDERRHLDDELDKVIKVMGRFVGRITRLRWVTAGYGWLAIVAPIVIAVPGYFQGQLTFGELMMTVGAFNQVQSSLRWFVDNLSGIADWQAALLRVMSFRDAASKIEKAERSRTRINILDGSQVLAFRDVTVCVSNREISLDASLVKVRPGERVLIIGKPGIGKSLFFRAIAGLWPWGRGTIELPQRSGMMFVPQRSYVAGGSLRHVLAYPVDPGKFHRSDLIRALRQTNLGHLVPSLDRVMRWDKVLTASERSYLSFAQLLVHRPQWIISDEALSNLNEDDRTMVFSLFKNELAKAAVLSIASSDPQHAFYSRVFHLVSHSVSNSARGDLGG
ncbi:ABC transporter ATP-binding protein/permease [Nordella sp. HKS 07]|uniref:ABC transporter ATP-binding protein/permease n=1 Tax=Nordella sp. HKS 07 TaxID=2712222 RepID=UPI0013E12B8B|nr:ABC transporter ATP-binding protein/permease [Nordella sp. HKS 07]QIG48369.1 ABC transporter ATP-binding protein/permease [Nordella sp. HKS 07]